MCIVWQTALDNDFNKSKHVVLKTEFSLWVVVTENNECVASKVWLRCEVMVLASKCCNHRLHSTTLELYLQCTWNFTSFFCLWSCFASVQITIASIKQMECLNQVVRHLRLSSQGRCRSHHSSPQVLLSPSPPQWTSCCYSCGTALLASRHWAS
jgi:hypothetical protein